MTDNAENLKKAVNGLKYAAKYLELWGESVVSQGDVVEAKEVTSDPVIVINEEKPYKQAPSKIVVPRESDLTAFYGAPSKNLATAWFDFPKGAKIRLYTRTGDFLRDRDNDGDMEHKCHPKLVSRVEGALNELWFELGEDEFYKQGWHLFCGCHNYRRKKAGGSLSTHSWAIALDFNAEENGLYKKTTTFSSEAIDIWEKWGFLSAGRSWGITVYDWMHFQAAVPSISSNSCSNFSKSLPST